MEQLAPLEDVFHKIRQRTVNSFHNWGLKSCPNNFKVTYFTNYKISIWIKIQNSLIDLPRNEVT